MKRIWLLFLLFFIPMVVSAQLDRIGGGLAFSSGIDYNHYRTGNPGLWIKPYFRVLPKMYLIPSVTIFNRYKRTTFTEEVRNYMFHGDVDLQYQVFQQDEIKIVLMAGLNATGLISRYDMLVDVGDPLDNISDLGLGANIGAGLEMIINNYYDAVLTTKYVAGTYSQFVINLGVLYYINPKQHRHGR